MSDIDKEKVIEKRWEEFYEWLETCPIEWTEGRHPTSGMISVNFDVETEHYKKPKEIPQEDRVQQVLEQHIQDWVKGYNKWKKTQ